MQVKQATACLLCVGSGEETDANNQRGILGQSGYREKVTRNFSTCAPKEERHGLISNHTVLPTVSVTGSRVQDTNPYHPTEQLGREQPEGSKTRRKSGVNVSTGCTVFFWQIDHLLCPVYSCILSVHLAD